jgi:hypothetical protein
MAKKFFYVCAGLLCLALSFQFGAQSAVGQSTPVIEAVDCGSGTVSAIVNGVWEQVDPTTGAIRQSAPVPVAGQVIATGSSYGVIVYENGDIYQWGGGPIAGWTRTGNLVSGPTPAKAESFGSVKARYR